MIEIAAADEAGDLVVARIVYLSQSSVYIDKGGTDGLTEESTLSVHRDGRKIAELDVAYLANHSASCRVRTLDVELVPGDEVRYRAIQSAVDPAPAGRGPPERVEGRAVERPPSADVSRLRGRVALQWNAFLDGNGTDGHFQQPSLYVRLEGSRLGGRPLDLNVHLRTEYLRRASSLASSRPADEWIHRFYQLSLTWNDTSLPFRLSVGRLFANDLRGVGSWDGALFETRVGHGWRFGLLGGRESVQRVSEPDVGGLKYGAYATFQVGSAIKSGYRGTVGVVGRYSDGTANREFVVWTNELASERLFRIRQDLELDVNRGSRKDAAGGKQTTVSRFNLLVNGRVSRSVRLHTGYDYFRSFFGLSTREDPDGPFFDHRLQRLRIGVNWRVSAAWGLRGDGGLRSGETEALRAFFANTAVSWSHAASQTSVHLRYGYFDGTPAQGHAPALDVQRSFAPSLHLGAGLGVQFWDGFRRDSLALEGRWARFFGTWTVKRRIDVQWMVLRTIGDIGPGTRGQLELAHRL
jgi:hypothetical protein